MELYSLESNGYNDGEYEDFDSFDMFYGVFSTIEKAKEYAEKLMEETREGNNNFVTGNWYESGGILFKEVTYDDCGNDWTETYSISRITVDPEFKEDK